MKSKQKIIILAFLFAACEPSNPVVDIHPAVNKSSTSLEIKNTETSDYNDMSITINDDYELRGQTIPAGETGHFSLEDFSKSDGTRFSTDQITKTVEISCKYGTKDAFYLGDF